MVILHNDWKFIFKIGFINICLFIHIAKHFTIKSFIININILFLYRRYPFYLLLFFIIMKEALEKLLSKYPANRKEGLLPILQDIQKEQGYLPEEFLGGVSKYLNLPVNKIYGVAAFYDQFRFHPLGQHHIQICRGTACHLYGSSTYLMELEKQLKVKAGSISRDRKFSLEISNCMGSCESAPVVRVNNIFYSHVTPEELTRIIRSLKEKTE